MFKLGIRGYFFLLGLFGNESFLQHTYIIGFSQILEYIFVVIFDWFDELLLWWLGFDRFVFVLIECGVGCGAGEFCGAGAGAGRGF